MSSSLYRKYRSQTFDELVGQEPVVRTLKNAISSGLISHAYLFTGPRGVGKTSAARLLARAANCLSEGPDKPCNECANCLAATRDIATDLIEIDAASNTGVDNIREIIERANFAPSIWNTKFYIVDEVHMLSTSAFNALLKTLEEPPPHTSFILATTEVHKVPATVASRCQRFDFRRIPLTAMTARLQYICEQEGIEAEQPALELVARQATGSLRDALSLLDQLRVYSEGGITLASVQDLLGASGSEQVAAFVDEVVVVDLAGGLRRINAVMEEGLDLRQFNHQVVDHLRALMLLKSGAASASAEGALLDVTGEMRAKMASQAEKTTMPDLLRWVKAFADADATLRSTAYAQLPLELALVSATLTPEEKPSAPVKDHSADLAASIERVGARPQRPGVRGMSDSEGRSEVGYTDAPKSSVPPPIRSAFGSIGNGQAVVAGSNGNRKQLNEVGDAVETDHTEVVSDAGALEGEDEFARLVRLWPDVVDQIKARAPNIAGVFGNPTLTRPFSLAGSVCTISFRDPIHVTRSRGEKQREIIENALNRVLGRSCRLESITFAEAEAGGLQNESDPDQPRHLTREKPSPYDTPRGRAAMNIFGIDKFE